MARILALGSTKWTSQRATTATLRRVMALYRDPYVLVCDMSDGAARFAAAGARALGWEVEQFEFDQAKCTTDCPTEGHRRPGGPDGTYCPTARYRNAELMLDAGVDLCVAFVRSGTDGHRRGQENARRRDIGVWTVEQPSARKGGE